MNFVGGYKVISFEDLPLAENTSTTIDGIYNAIGNTRKVILAEQINIGGVKMHSSFMAVSSDNGKWILSNGNITLSVDNTDKVTIVSESEDE